MCSEPFQGIVLLCGDTAGLALTFGREGFQPFLEDPAVKYGLAQMKLCPLAFHVCLLTECY